MAAPFPAAPAGIEARSYLADGRVVRWRPRVLSPLRIAVDAELADQSVPPALERRFGVADPRKFWTQWTRVEVCCKLLDVPVLQWLAIRGLASDVPEIAMHTQTLDGLVVTCGFLRDDG